MKYIKNIFLKIIKFLFLYSMYLFILSNINKNESFIKNNINIKNNKLISFNIYSNFNYLKKLYFNLTYINYFYSLKYQIVKIEYKIRFYDELEKIISPSDLTLYNDLNIICHIKIRNTNNTIDSLANIYKNQYYQCIEFFNINEKVKFGIKIYKKKKCKVDYVIYYFINNNMNYNNPKNKKDAIFDPLIINEKYCSLIEKIKNNTLKNLYKLKNSYIKYPNYLLKTNTSINVSEWIFQNIYNHYFCYCKGYNCSFNRINQKCKYNFYLNIIDNNRDIYSKTHYLFIDFIFNQFPPDDTYPVFKKMYEEGLPVHYITERLDIYKKYCGHLNNCTIIIKINKNNYYNFGDFLKII